MSVKIERDTVRRTTESAADFARDAGREVSRHDIGHDITRDAGREFARDVGRELQHIPGTSGKHPIAEKLGTAITGGKGNAGTRGYLMVRLISSAFPFTLGPEEEEEGLRWTTLDLTG